MTKPVNRPYKTLRQPVEPGTRFGKWMTIGNIDWDDRRVWCICECGVEHKVRINHLRSCRTLGCQKCNTSRQTHGKANSRVYTIWKGMLRRCGLMGNQPHDSYAGRGITVCERWHKFENFLADMGEPAEKHSIERINNDGNYEPGNCRWATHKQQMNNLRRSAKVTWDGETMTYSQRADFFGMSQHILGNRLRAGWDFEKAVTTPVKSYRNVR